MNSQKTAHTSPFRASYGVSFMSTSTEIDRVIKGFYCTTLYKGCNSSSMLRLKLIRASKRCHLLFGVSFMVRQGYLNHNESLRFTQHNENHVYIHKVVLHIMGIMEMNDLMYNGQNVLQMGLLIQAKPWTAWTWRSNHFHVCGITYAMNHLLVSLTNRSADERSPWILSRKLHTWKYFNNFHNCTQSSISNCSITYIIWRGVWCTRLPITEEMKTIP